ncbi:MAG: hypothetical protein AAF928_12680 [Myxococcota bacterium]
MRVREAGSRLGLAAVAWLVLMGPVAGDIGGCGQDAEELDAVLFFEGKQFVECNRCIDCGIETPNCQTICNEPLIDPSFDPDCLPLAHDGEVCLNAIEAASCDAFARIVDATAPTVPTECNFCPPDRRLEEVP